MTTSPKLCQIVRESAAYRAAKAAAAIYGGYEASARKAPTDPFYMSRHPHFCAEMRAVLVDYMIGVSSAVSRSTGATSGSGGKDARVVRWPSRPRLALAPQVSARCQPRCPETLYRAIQFLDRYLAATEDAVGPDLLQMIAVSAFSLACKIETDDPPNDMVLARQTADYYSGRALAYMQQAISVTLNYRLHTPTTFDLLMCLCLADGADEDTCALAVCFLDRASLAYDLLELSASHLAASVLYLANTTHKRPGWTYGLFVCTGFREEVFAACLARVVALVRTPVHERFRGLRHKYDVSVTGTPQLWIPPLVPPPPDELRALAAPGSSVVYEGPLGDF